MSKIDNNIRLVSFGWDDEVVVVRGTEKEIEEYCQVESDSRGVGHTIFEIDEVEEMIKTWTDRLAAMKTSHIDIDLGV